MPHSYYIYNPIKTFYFTVVWPLDTIHTIHNVNSLSSLANFQVEIQNRNCNFGEAMNTEYLLYSIEIANSRVYTVHCTDPVKTFIYI